MSPTTARIDMRVSQENRDIIDQAAEKQGVDRTSFVLDAAMSKARSVLVEETVMRMTAREIAQVREILNAEIVPNASLKRAADRLKELGL